MVKNPRKYLQSSKGVQLCQNLGKQIYKSCSPLTESMQTNSSVFSSIGRSRRHWVNQACPALPSLSHRDSWFLSSPCLHKFVFRWPSLWPSLYINMYNCFCVPSTDSEKRGQIQNTGKTSFCF